MRGKFLWLIGAGASLVCTALVLGLQYRIGGPLPGTPNTNLLDTLHTLCVADMLASTCKVMGTGSAAQTAKPGELVFVAGVGAIDAVAYQQMYAAGDAMCSVVRSACTQDWDGQQCRTARKIYKL